MTTHALQVELAKALVGDRVYDGKKTYCQREIPPADRRIAPLASLNVCSRCATLCARAEKFLHRASA